MEKIGIYYRVSTERQENEKTIETQKDVMERIYKDRNVVKRYSDEGYSGTMAERPALDELKRDIENGEISVVASYDIDRFGRDVYLHLLFSEFREKGVRIEIQGTKIEETPEGELTTGIQVEIARWIRKKIIQKLRDGKYRKINNGILIGCSPAFGYKLFRRNPITGEEARFEIIKEEAYKVRQVFKTYLEKQSLRQTIKKLANLKIFARNGKPFTPKTIKRMLSNETYVGNFYFGKTYPFGKKNPRGQRNGRKLRAKSEWKLIKLPDLVLIDKTTFDRVQEVLDYRAKHFLKETKYQHLCQGLVRCIHCGRIYTAKPTANPYKGKRYLAYFCSTNSAKPIGEPRCKSRQMSQTKLESAIWDYVKDLIWNPDKVKKAVRLSREKRKSKRDSNKKQYDILMAGKMEIKTRKSKFLDLYGDDKYSKEDLDLKIVELNNQEIIFDKQIQGVKMELQSIDKTEAIEKEIEKTCLKYQKRIDNPSFELKKAIVRRWIKEINITDEGKIILKVIVPEIMGEPFELMPSPKVYLYQQSMNAPES